MPSATARNLNQVIFRSRASRPWQAGELQALSLSAHGNDPGHCITGIGIYDGYYFLQVIEGAAEALDEALARIRDDERHFDLVVLVHEGIAQRRFSDFSMNVLNLSSRSEVKAVESHSTPSNMLGTVSLGSFHGMHEDRAKGIIEAFANGRWRDDDRPEAEAMPAKLAAPSRTLPAALAAKLAEQGYAFAFQPIVDLIDRSVSSYEALIRGARGESPKDLLSSLKGKELHQLDLLSKGLAIQTAAYLGLGAARLSLNLLPGALLVQEDTVGFIAAQAHQHGIDPRQIVIEITEEELIADIGATRKIIDQIKGAGMAVAIDDFGAGYAGLSMLADVQPNKLKIDISIIRGIDSNGPRQAIVRAIVEFCYSLGITVVAEGVETIGELHWLRKAGVHRIQGFLFAKPLLNGLPEVVWPQMRGSRASAAGETAYADPIPGATHLHGLTTVVALRRSFG